MFLSASHEIGETIRMCGSNYYRCLRLASRRQNDTRGDEPQTLKNNKRFDDHEETKVELTSNEADCEIGS